MVRFKRKLFWIILGIVGWVYLNNASWLVTQPTEKPQLLAHRGLGQTFPVEGLTNETCTASRIYPPEHPYLENTLPSMAAAFTVGAAIVELDLQLTRDGHFAVFHDWTLDCRTNGQGVTREHTLAELQQLDIGYGYTADHGRTYPFRGKGVGMMPSLDAVFERFPDKHLLLHIKSNDPGEGKRLVGYLASVSSERLKKLAVYGGDQPIAVLHRAIPELRVMSKRTLVTALLSYMAIGWTGYIPAACRNTEVHLPEKFTRWLWGWPYRFQERMAKANTRVILVAGGSKFSEGFDEVADLKRIPPNYTGFIWTNRIDRIGSVIGKKR